MIYLCSLFTFGDNLMFFLFNLIIIEWSAGHWSSFCVVRSSGATHRKSKIEIFDEKYDFFLRENANLNPKGGADWKFSNCACASAGRHAQFGFFSFEHLEKTGIFSSKFFTFQNFSRILAFAQRVQWGRFLLRLFLVVYVFYWKF